MPAPTGPFRPLDGDRSVSRRAVLRLSAAGVFAAVGAGLAGCVGPAAPSSTSARPSPATIPSPRPAVTRPVGVLGANFNGDPAVMTTAELQAVGATWIRGFFAMPDADRGDPAAQPAIQALLAADGYGTVLSLKFPYNDKPIPAAGSADLASAQRRLDAVLAAVMDKVDILVIGNEPFIESRVADHGDVLNEFYEGMAQRAIAYRAAHFPSGSRTTLYMGALNHLDEPSWRTTATDRWMRFVHDTPELAGTDIHPHLPAPGADQAYLDYILPRMRSDQTFLATEFSLVLYFREQLRKPVAAAYAKRYGLAKGTPAWEAIRAALQHPVSQQQWDAFFATTPWLAQNKTFLTDQVGRFRATGKLAVATYGIGQDAAMSSSSFGPTSPPWLLNSMFCQHTVHPAADGLPGRNTWWTEEFQALQHG